jgi:hypothetical protein
VASDSTFEVAAKDCAGVVAGNVHIVSSTRSKSRNGEPRHLRGDAAVVGVLAADLKTKAESRDAARIAARGTDSDVPCSKTMRRERVLKATHARAGCCAT